MGGGGREGEKKKKKTTTKDNVKKERRMERRWRGWKEETDGRRQKNTKGEEGDMKGRMNK